jgi:Transposase DDE domain
MLRIREVKTKVGSRSVQVIRYSDGKRIIVKHVGTGNTDEEVVSLKEIARSYIEGISQQTVLFSDTVSQPDDRVTLSQCEYLGFYYSFLYDVLKALQDQIGYTAIADAMLTDLVIIRIVEAASKLRSIELMDTYFGIRHRRQRYYESAPHWLSLKDIVEKQTLHFAQQEYSFDFSLLFYDVTTLYFETFESDELRKTGFSKDGKSQQPQILVALMVTQDGFPIAYEVFAGNTFEGHTMLPVIEAFIRKHKVRHFTVVADAAMISTANIAALRQASIHYIVGARLGNIPAQLLDGIDQSLPRENGKIIRLKTENGYLICSFSKQRYKKDKYEMEKQIEKARLLLGQPSKASKIKFLKTEEAKITLNEELIDKTIKLLGVKGYYTDIAEEVADSKTIIERYHDLYKIEQAFRISKNDLKTRPIFHFREEPIQLHLLICFMALAVSKHIELKTQTSIRAFITECRKVTDARLRNKITKKEIRMRAEPSPLLQRMLAKFTRPH